MAAAQVKIKSISRPNGSVLHLARSTGDHRHVIPVGMAAMILPGLPTVTGTASPLLTGGAANSREMRCNRIGIP
jgi:hypothetical protein